MSEQRVQRVPTIGEFECALIRQVNLINIRFYNGHIMAEAPVPGRDRGHIIHDWRRESLHSETKLELIERVIGEIQKQGPLADNVSTILKRMLQDARSEFQQAFFSPAMVTITGYLNDRGEANSPPWLTINPPRGNVPEAQIYFASGPYSSGSRWFVHQRGHPGQFRWFHEEEMIKRHGIVTTSGQFHVFAIGTDKEPAVVERPTPDGPKFFVILADRILEEETFEEIRKYLLPASAPDSTDGIGKVVAVAEPPSEELNPPTAIAVPRPVPVVVTPEQSMSIPQIIEPQAIKGERPGKGKKAQVKHGDDDGLHEPGNGNSKGHGSRSQIMADAIRESESELVAA